MNLLPATPDSDSPTLPMNRRQLRLLVVDDDPFDRRAVRRCLIESNACQTIDEAATADDMLQAIGSTAYDCILLDYYIPGSSGIELLRRIRDRAPDMPVVMFTGRGDEEIAVELMKAGASDYLPKASLTTERLIASVRHAIDLSRTSAAHRHAAEELRRQEERFRTLANAIPQFAWTLDEDGVSWFNQRWYEYTGTTKDQMQGWNAQDTIHPDHAQRVMEGLRHAIRSGKTWEDTFPIRGKDGQYRWFLSRALPIRTSDTTVTGWLGTNTDVTEQITARAERERLLAQEQQARAEAEQAVRARDEVLAFVAHDLRTPLSTIIMSARTLLNASDASARQKGLDIVQRATGEMERLIHDLLDIARIESEGFTVNRVRVDVPPLLEQMHNDFREQAQAKRITLVCDADAAPPVWADQDRLAQVLSNLLSNALKFTPTGGTVTLKAREDEGHTVIAITDTGPGIKADHLPHIFDRFWQADRTSGSGAGLGLAICKGIVEAHGGRIEADSPPGEGTTMCITLPAASR